MLLKYKSRKLIEEVVEEVCRSTSSIPPLSPNPDSKHYGLEARINAKNSMSAAQDLSIGGGVGASSIQTTKSQKQDAGTTLLPAIKRSPPYETDDCDVTPSRCWNDARNSAGEACTKMTPLRDDAAAWRGNARLTPTHESPLRSLVPSPTATILAGAPSLKQHAMIPMGAGELDPKAEVEAFLRKFASLRAGGIVTRKDVSVKELRHVIPLLIMDIYGFKDEPAQKKVKGLWDQAPKNWPPGVPYLDPNNGQRGSHGKPRKDILIQMFHYLIMEYQRQKGPDCSNVIRFCNSPEPLSSGGGKCPDSNPVVSGRRWSAEGFSTSTPSHNKSDSYRCHAESTQQLCSPPSWQERSRSISSGSWNSQMSPSFASPKTWSDYPAGLKHQQDKLSAHSPKKLFATAASVYSCPNYQRQMSQISMQVPPHSSSPMAKYPPHLMRHWSTLTHQGYAGTRPNTWSAAAMPNFMKDAWSPTSPTSSGRTELRPDSWQTSRIPSASVCFPGQSEYYPKTESKSTMWDDYNNNRFTYHSASHSPKNSTESSQRRGSEEQSGVSPSRREAVSPSYSTSSADFASASSVTNISSKSQNPPPLIPINELNIPTTYPPTPPSSAPSPSSEEPEDLVLKPHSSSSTTLDAPTRIKTELPDDDDDDDADDDDNDEVANDASSGVVETKIGFTQHRRASESPASSTQDRKRRYSEDTDSAPVEKKTRYEDSDEEECEDDRWKKLSDTLGAWNPHEECTKRLNEKLSWVEKNNVLSGGDVGLLSITKDLLYKLGLLTDRRTEQFWLEKVHEFEGTLDIISLWGEITSAHRKKWNEFQNQWYVKIVTLHNRLHQDNGEREDEENNLPLPLHSPVDPVPT